MNDEVKVIEYKKLVHDGNQYALKIPAIIMSYLNYDRLTDCFKLVLEKGKLNIEFIKYSEEGKGVKDE